MTAPGLVEIDWVAHSDHRARGAHMFSLNRTASLSGGVELRAGMGQGQPKKRYGLGAVNDHTGETVVFFRRRKRRRESAELLQALVDKHPTGTIYVAWDNAHTHQDDEVEALVRGAAGRLVLLYLPTYSRWLNPIEMLWRHFRREVTHCELFEGLDALPAARNFFEDYTQCPERILSIIGAHSSRLS